MSVSKRLKELENMLSEYDSIFYKLEELKNPIKYLEKFLDD